MQTGRRGGAKLPLCQDSAIVPRSAAPSQRLPRSAAVAKPSRSTPASPAPLRLSTRDHNDPLRCRLDPP